MPDNLWAEPQFASHIHEVQKEMWVEMTLRVPRNPDQHQNSNLPANCNIRAAYANGDPAADDALTRDVADGLPCEAQFNEPALATFNQCRLAKGAHGSPVRSRDTGSHLRTQLTQ